MISWFGIPGKRPGSCMTHVVRNGKPICGTRQHPDAEEQICSSESAYSAKLVECKKCARILSANNAVRGAAEPRTLDGLVGHSESEKGA